MIKKRTVSILAIYAMSLMLVMIADGYSSSASTRRIVRQVESKSEGPTLIAQLGHSGSLNSVALSADGKYLLTCSNDFTAKLWEVESGRELRSFIGHPTLVLSVAISADSRYAITGSSDSTAKLWEMESGKPVRTFTGHAKGVTSVALSSDGKYLVTGSVDETAKLWEVESGRELRTFSVHSEVHSVAISADGKYLVTGDADHLAKLWEVESGKELRPFTGHSEYVHSVALSRDGKYLVTGSADSTAKLWEVETGHELRTFSGHSSLVTSVAFSADGKHLATGSTDGATKLWEVQSGREVHSFGGQSGSVVSLALSADGKYLVTGHTDDTAKLWEVQSGREVRSFRGYSNWVRESALSSDGMYLITGNEDGAVKLWEMESGKELRTFSGHSGPVSSVALSADRKYLVTGGRDAMAKLWEMESGKELRTFTVYSTYQIEVALSADGKYLVTHSWDRAAKLWEVESGRELRTFDSEADSNPVVAMALSADDKYLVTSHMDNTAKLWEVQSGKKLHTFSGHSGSVSSVALSADGKYLVTGSSDGTAKLWEIASGKELRTFDAFSKPSTSVSVSIFSVALSRDGKYLVTSHWDRTAKLWEVESGRELRTFIGHSSPVHTAAFSADGKYLVTGSMDMTTRIWNIQSGKELCRLLSFSDDNWAVVTPDGFFDASNLDEIKGLHWIMPDEPMKPLPVEIFMRDFYQPRLLLRLLNGETFTTSQSIAEKNRVQPPVTITSIEQQKDNPELVTVAIRVSKATGEFKQSNGKIIRETGVYDLRLFRDGQLVELFPKPALPVDIIGQNALTQEQERALWRARSKIELDNNGKRLITFKNIRLPRRAGIQQVEFSAYAFNEDRVKSATDRKIFDLPKDLAPVKGRAYLLTVGVNRFDNSDWNLRFAVNDARLAQTTLAERLRQSGEFAEVIEMPLISDAKPVAGAKAATKANFKAALDQIARQAKPEDMVIITYSSHGYVDRKGEFYLLPTDTGTSKGQQITQQLLSHAISSEELSEWLRGVDAGEMLLVIDACQSAGTVKGEAGGEFKPGPMGSRGLGQLAYDKGMRILAASQADDLAFEQDELQHGLLTFALLKDGVEGRKADANKDGMVTLSEALAYALERVPKLYEAMRKNELRQLFATEGGQVPAVKGPVSSAKRKNAFQKPSLFDFAKNRAEIILVK